MAIRKIARMGHPVLRRRAREVADPASPEFRALVADMIETMEDVGGVGLAAPQIHIDLRVVIFFVPAERDGGEAQPLTVLVNPVIEPQGAEQAMGWEACLSVPGLMGAVLRHTRIRYSGFDLDGQPIRRDASGFHARVVQHECDHLDGILYPQRMTDLSLLGYVEEMHRLVPEGQAVESE
jgi:peptide deformylase